MTDWSACDYMLPTDQTWVWLVMLSISFSWYIQIYTGHSTPVWMYMRTHCRLVSHCFVNAVFYAFVIMYTCDLQVWLLVSVLYLICVCVCVCVRVCVCDIHVCVYVCVCVCVCVCAITFVLGFRWLGAVQPSVMVARESWLLLSYCGLCPPSLCRFAHIPYMPSSFLVYFLDLEKVLVCIVSFLFLVNVKFKIFA